MSNYYSDYHIDMENSRESLYKDNLPVVSAEKADKLLKDIFDYIERTSRKKKSNGQSVDKLKNTPITKKETLPEI